MKLLPFTVEAFLIQFCKKETLRSRLCEEMQAGFFRIKKVADVHSRCEIMQSKKWDNRKEQKYEKYD